MSTPLTSLTLLAQPVTISTINGKKTIQFIKTPSGAPIVPETEGVFKNINEVMKYSNEKSQVEGLVRGPNIPTGQIPARAASTSAFSIGDFVKFLPQFAEVKAISYLSSFKPKEAIKKVLLADIIKIIFY